jgi:hypothetical protein
LPVKISHPDSHPAKIADCVAAYFVNALIRKEMHTRVGWHDFGIKPGVA